MIYGELEQRSGGYLYDRLLVEGLRQQGDQVDILSLPARRYAFSLLNNFSIGRSKHAGYDILLQDELSHPSLFRANRSLRWKGPIVTIVHHLRCSEPHASTLQRLYASVESAYFQTVDAAVYNSQVTRSTVEALVGKRLPNVVATPGADHISSEVDVERVQDRARGSGPLQVVFIGNLIPRKGLHRLIAALQGIASEKWHLSVVGSLKFDEQYGKRIERMSNKPNIRLLGVLDHDHIAELLSQSHVLAMPSAYEGFGIAYLEGMAFGLPAVASTAGGASDLVRDGVNGFLVRPDDEEHLRDRLAHLMDDRELLVRMGTAALDTYHRHPSWKLTTSKIREFLLEIATVRSGEVEGGML